MELNTFFRSYIETEEEPVVICDLDYRIIYINKASAVANERFGGYAIVGKSLNSLMDLETQSKINMVVEWFKEGRDNNRVFAFHDNKKNLDMYILAIRNGSGDLIGFYGREESRTPDQSRPFDLD